MRNYLDTEQGAKAQWELIKRWDSSENYIVDSWLSDMYLKSRLALPINSSPALILPKMNFDENFGYCDFLNFLVHEMFSSRDIIEKDDFCGFNENGKNTTEMCKDQYKRIFTCYRKPKSDIDELVRRTAGEYFIISGRKQTKS